MSERRRCSHFFLFPFFFFLLVFLRPPGITGLMEGFLVGDGFGAAAVSAVAGAETSAVAVAAAGASATGAGASIVFASALVSPDSASCLTTGVVGNREATKLKSISDSPAASVSCA